MEAYESRLQSFTKARRVKKSTAKRAVSLKWPHPTHFIATPDTLTEAGFFFNPSWDARDNVECYFCGKCLDGWEEQDDPFSLHWDKCRDTCAWAVLRCGLNDDVDRKGNFAAKDSSRQPDGKPMEKARLATFKLNNSWPHDRVKGHGANSTKMAKAGFTFTPQTPGDDTGTCLYCRVSLSGWDKDDDPLEEHHKRVQKSNLTCPFFPEASGPKSRSRTTSLRSTTRPKSRAGSRQPRPAATETSTSHSDEDSQPVPPRPAQRSRTTSMLSASKERDASDVLRRSTRSSRAKPTPEVEEDASGTELSKSTLGQSRSKSSGKGKGKGPIEVIEEADEDDITRVVLPTKQRVKGKENVAHDTKVPRSRRHTKILRVNDTEEEARPPKRRPPKKGKAALDDREESSPDVDSECEVQPVRKRRTRVVESISSGEVSPQETKPKASIKKVKGKAPIDVPELEDDCIPETKAQSRPIKKKLPKAPAQRQAKARVTKDGNEGSDDEPQHVEQAEKSSLSHDRGKDNAQSRPVATLESTATASSSEEAVIPSPAPAKKSSRDVKVNGSESTGATESHPERCRPRTTSESNHPSNPFVSEGDEVQADVADIVDIESDAASAPATPALRTGATTLLSGSKPVRDMDDRVFAPLARSSRSPECPEPRTLERDENPATPPPAPPARPSSSMLSVSSTTSTTKVEGQTDTETLVESLPVRTNGARLPEEERIMTVEQWIRREIEVQYERLKRDGEAKIRLFREQAEEVRRQIEAL